MAGKTGTSQKVDPKTKSYSDKNHVAAFVGFTPVGDSRLVIGVVIDEPKGVPFGGAVAGPVFREVAQWSLNHLHINPQSQPVVLAKAPLRRPAKTWSGKESRAVNRIARQLKSGFLPDFRGLCMREVIEKARALGLKVLLEGSGRAVKQSPAPGSPMGALGTIRVTFMAPARARG